jgi:TRAP-type C4-dicarboxylate transport system permease small subunit
MRAMTETAHASRRAQLTAERERVNDELRTPIRHNQLGDSAGVIGAAMSVRKNNHIQVDYFYRLMPKAMGRVVSTAVDVVRCLFLGYAVWLTWLLLQRIGSQQMAVIDLPVGIVFSCMLFGFTLMFLRSLQVAWRHWQLGYSVLERPEAFEG